MGIVYLILRYMNQSFSLVSLLDNPMSPTNLYEKILTMPSIISYYFNTLVLPINLKVWQNWKISSVSFNDVILPTISIAITTIVFIGFTASQKIQIRRGLTFFGVWFVLGIITLLQIFPLDMTVSDRWFYFPFIGLLGIFGLLYERYAAFLKRYTLVIVLLSCILCTLYGIRTFYRSFDWQNNKEFYTHELILQPDNAGLNYNLGSLYTNENDYKNALVYLEKVAKVAPKYNNTLVIIAVIYFRQEDYNKAIYYFNKARDLNVLNHTSQSLVNKGLAETYSKIGKYEEVEKLITEKVISESSDPNRMLYLRAEAKFKLKKYQEAHSDLDYIYHTTLDPEVDKLYKEIEKNLP